MSLMPAGFDSGSALHAIGDAVTDAVSAGDVEAAGAAPATPPALGPGAFDVTAVSPSQITAMKASTDPAQRSLGFTIENARLNFSDTISQGGRVVASLSADNGGRPVLTIVPPGFDASKPARVHTHYHGFNATVADPVGHSSGTTARIEEVQKADPQTVFVLPECQDAPAVPSRLDGKINYATDWKNVKSPSGTATDALAAAGLSGVTISQRVISAHSGGGAALAAAMAAHPDGSGLACDRLELLDCFYGSEAQVAQWAKTPAGKACADVTYYHGTNTHSDAQVKALLGARYHRINVGQPSAAADPILRNAAGQPIVDVHGKPCHRFNQDPHNYTIGAFMDDLGHPGAPLGLSGKS